MRPLPRRAKQAHYSVSFRLEAVRRVEAGEMQRVLAVELGVVRITLIEWLRRYGTATYARMKRKMFAPAQKHAVARGLRAGRLSEDEALLKYGIGEKKTLRVWVAAQPAGQGSPRPHARRVRAGRRVTPGAMANRGPAHAHRPSGSRPQNRHSKKGWCQAAEVMRQKSPPGGGDVLRAVWQDPKRIVRPLAPGHGAGPARRLGAGPGGRHPRRPALPGHAQAVFSAAATTERTRTAGGPRFPFCLAVRPGPAVPPPQAAGRHDPNLPAVIPAAQPHRALGCEPRRAGLGERHHLRAPAQRLELPGLGYGPVPA